MSAGEGIGAEQAAGPGAAGQHELIVLAVLPELLNTNGDAENAAVLARRAQWAGTPARVVAAEGASGLPAHADLVVIGSGEDTALPATVERMAAFRPFLEHALREGVPVLAVGTGWEALARSIALPGAGTLPGLGLLAGDAVPGERVVGEIVVDSPRFGRLVGFENHQRGFVLAPADASAAAPLGSVVSGRGNGAGGGGAAQEGMVAGSLIGTHLHGPLLAKNPAVADAMLQAAFAARGQSYASGERSAAADEIARAARERVLAALDLARP